MKYIILYCLVTFFTIHICVGKTKDEKEILHMLEKQVTAWNKGQIDGYMQGYWEHDSLLFIGAKGPRYGYVNTLKRYKEAYPDKDHMGQLTSVVTNMKRLSHRYYFITGTWELKRAVGDVSGNYTLLLKKIKHHWVIVCDHSS
jgi:thymidylate synthase